MHVHAYAALQRLARECLINHYWTHGESSFQDLLLLSVLQKSLLLNAHAVISNIPWKCKLIQQSASFCFSLCHIKAKTIAVFKSWWEFIGGTREIVLLYRGIFLFLGTFSLEGLNECCIFINITKESKYWYSNSDTVIPKACPLLWDEVPFIMYSFISKCLSI